MKIGEAAKKAGISPGNIRFYEKKGLLKPLKRGKQQLPQLYRGRCRKTEEDPGPSENRPFCRKYFPASGWKRRSRLPSEKTGGNSGKSDERIGGFSSPLQKTGTGGRDLLKADPEKYLQFIQKEEQKGRRFFPGRGTPWRTFRFYGRVLWRFGMVYGGFRKLGGEEQHNSAKSKPPGLSFFLMLKRKRTARAFYP